jgi:hypothetical protein
MFNRITLLTFLGLIVLSVAPAFSGEPNWQGTVVARGPQRVQIQSTDMVRRPYRPLHFYGNTVRRRHYRGTAIPQPKDFFQGLNSLIAR